uniref:Uncharacterized protein n=1 Tax=Rhodopseudomonas palustris (strain BisA53) TaxID=316055 RepID=Q07MH0_RHOP5
MFRLITTMVGLVLLAGGAALAQTAPGSGVNPSVPPSLSPDQRVIGEAPVGHRQPRRDSSGDIDPFARDPADVALDRKIRSICRGC